MPTVVCEKHGLRFDPTAQSGCVVCRREAGELRPAVAPPPVAAKRAGIALPLLGAIALWLGAAGLLFSAHREIANAYLAEVELAKGKPPVAEESSVEAPVPDPGYAPTGDDTLQELEALQQEREARGGEETLAVPRTESLSQDAGQLGEAEEVDTAPVEIQVEGDADDGSGS